ncbi:hypothetical protein [Achromobacter ruhlandii]|uniref:hypothetical protein n=1 Tax=Achromobacter ruhlandii TaxID=72557 RepID=UPI001E48F313|nr:hypothetical protein [Achromobacter ruhlandii]
MPDGALSFVVSSWTVQAEQTTFNTPLTVNGPLRYTQGLSGEGGEGGASMTVRGGVAFEGGRLTHDGKDVGATHVHPNGMGGMTEKPV